MIEWTSGSQTFFVATLLEKFAGLATHQQYDVNRDTQCEIFIHIKLMKAR